MSIKDKLQIQLTYLLEAIIFLMFLNIQEYKDRFTTKRSDDEHLPECKAEGWMLESEATESDLPGLGEIRIVGISSRYSRFHEIWKEMMNQSKNRGLLKAWR
ncbi:MAG: hypothetical protein HS132_06465 [Planctomycetia bacterium]|nr:hypothetical protein [Planctomycetia bacterium]